MTAPHDFLDRLLAQAVEPTDTLALRAASITQLRANGLPHGEKLEAFKYTPITAFLNDDLLDRAQQSQPPSIRFASGSTPDGVTVSRSVAASGAPSAGHPLAQVNGSLLEEIVEITIADDHTIDEPLLLEYGGTGGCTRVDVRLGRRSRIGVIERHAQGDRSSNRVVNVALAAESHFEHRRVDVAPGDRSAWGMLHATVGDGAHYELDHYAAGAKPRRNEIIVDLRGRGASLDLTGAVVAAGRQSVDLQVAVNHFGVDTRSRQLIHGIAADKGQVTFNGRIEIHPSGDGSDARLTNRNLLLAPTARINAKPELEIHTRNVACSHGATVGQLDAAQLFYLRSRGIAERDARDLLTRAFLLRVITPAAAALGVDQLLREAIEP